MSTDLLGLTAQTEVFDHGHPAVTAFVEEAGCTAAPDLAGAVQRLHDGVRDGIDYTVFNVPLHDDLRASDVAVLGSGFCLHKNLLFVAGCRRLGVPAVLCSDVVTNHVADAAMTELVGGDEFLHWYTRLHLGSRWIKAAPVFNALLCRLYGIDVLSFDPEADAVEQPYEGGATMRYQGCERLYADPTMAELLDAVKERHPRMVTASGRTPTSLDLQGGSRVAP